MGMTKASKRVPNPLTEARWARFKANRRGFGHCGFSYCCL